jgi:hypothetical protein
VAQNPVLNIRQSKVSRTQRNNINSFWARTIQDGSVYYFKFIQILCTFYSGNKHFAFLVVP